MSSYGRNFEFRIPPRPEDRKGRYLSPTAIRIGAPVKCTDTTLDSQGRLDVTLATGTTTRKSGLHGILVYEYAPSAFAGHDPALTTFSDLDTAPAGSPVQVVSGTYVKVVLRNTVANNAFAGDITASGITRSAVNMVAPADLSGLAIGDYLEPGTGNDTDGYWVETGTAANAWLVITAVSTARGEVEAELTF